MEASFRRSKERSSLADVAKEAGVSGMTVSRFLNPRKRMELTPETRARIEVAIQKLGYVPSPFARKRRALEKYTFGLLTALSKDIINSGYHMGIVGGMVDRVFQTEHALKLFNFKDRPYERMEEIFYEQGIDGLLIITWRIDPHLIRLIEKTPADIPLVIFNDYDPKLHTNILYTDVRKGMKMAVSYLAEKGYTRIGMLTGPSQITFQKEGKTYHFPAIDAQEKLKGFLEGMKEKGITVKKTWLRECSYYSQEGGYEQMKKWTTKKKDLPEAIVSANDEIALGAWKALKEVKYWPGEKIALLGFDDIDRGRVISPSLTTIRQPLYQMGKDAVDILTERIEFPSKDPIRKYYEPELVIRQTA